MSIIERIKQQLEQDSVVLYMKGSSSFPQCGFSSKAVQLLQACQVDFVTVNVLEDDEIREGIKRYANWPTIPQLYVNGQFIGGSDIIIELYESGKLQDLLAKAHS